MRISRQLLASVLAVLTALTATSAAAQVPFLGGSLKRLAYQAAAKQIAPAVSEAAPINLDWNDLYPTVDAPPGGPFRADPRKIREQHRYLVAQMAKNPNAPVQLRPGDYVFFMRAYCTHAGPQAIPAHPQEPWPEYFQLAPLKGRRASLLPALYARAQLAHIPYRQTQQLSWSITNGVPYEQMPPEQQATFDKLVPQYKGLMEGDPVQSIRARWETMRHKMPLLPSLDAAVDKLGAVGTTIRSLEEAQRATIANANNFEQSKATLAPQTVMTPAPVPVKSWSRLSDRVYAKIKLPQNYHGIGSIVAVLVRVLPASGSPARPAKGSARDFDSVAYADGGGTAGADFGGSVGMPGQNGVQAVTLGPTPTQITGTTGPPPEKPPLKPGIGIVGSGISAGGSGGPGVGPANPQQANPPPGNLGNDYLNNGINLWNQIFGNNNSSGNQQATTTQSVNVNGSDPSEDQNPYKFQPNTP
jgi:hypothetical protein